MTNQEQLGETPSDGNQEQAPASPSGDIERLTNEVQRLAAMVSSMQGGKDRGVRAVQQQVDELTATLQAYEGYRQRYEGDEAIRQMKIDNLLQQQGTGQEQARPSAPQATRESGVDIAGIVAELGLKADDPKVMALAERHQANPARLQAALEGYAEAAGPPKPASPASVAQPTGGTVTAGQPDVIDQFRQELRSLGFGATPEARRQVRMKYRGHVPDEILWQ